MLCHQSLAEQRPQPRQDKKDANYQEHNEMDEFLTDNPPDHQEDVLM